MGNSRGGGNLEEQQSDGAGTTRTRWTEQEEDAGWQAGGLAGQAHAGRAGTWQAGSLWCSGGGGGGAPGTGKLGGLAGLAGTGPQ